MRKLLSILFALLMMTGTALACDQTVPAAPDMIAALLPGYTHVDSIDDGDELRLLMRNPDGALVFIGGVLDASGQWALTESTPLPEGTILGVENFTHSLGIPSGTYVDCINVSPYADGTWGVSMVMPAHSGMCFMGQHVIFDEVNDIDGHFGSHPWADITTIDWTTLPASYEEALAQLDATGWAVVNNPDREDRLHLRVSPDKNAASLGKYYNRTPVKIRQYGKEWCAVTVCGLDGWMMTDFLAFGADKDAVGYAGPWLTWKEELTELLLYEKPRASSAYAVKTRPEHWPAFYVMGVAGDFYHVWMPDTEEYGYIRMNDLWEGNG